MNKKLPSVKESWTERFDKKFVKSELTFNGVVVKRSCLCLGHCECNLFMTAEPKEIKAFITSELETARKEERLRSAKIVEELMEDSEHWQPIASRIMDRVIIIKEDLY